MNIRSKFSEIDFLSNAPAAGTVISSGSTIEGRITTPNIISVSGLVKGELNASEIVIEKEGSVNGSIFAEHLIIVGNFKGKVSASKILEVEKLDAKIGETIKFKNVLLLNNNTNTEIGSPNIEGATVEAKLLDNVKDRTVLVFHKRRRKHSRKKNGHRQRYAKIQIMKILAKGGKVIDEAKIIEKKKTIKAEKKDIKKDAKK